MSELKLTPGARADLDATWDYTATHWGVDQAEAYLLSLSETMQFLANQPGLGRNIDDIKTGYYKFLAASHILIFRKSTNAIEIVRVLHKSMDVELHFE